MNVIFKSNLDNYQTNCFPLNLTIPPRIGETVLVTKIFEQRFKEMKLPTRLKVIDVIWSEKNIVCELWYKQIDVDIAEQNGVNLF